MELNEILEKTALAFGVTVDELKSPSRKQRFSVPRNVFMLVSKEIGHDYCQITDACNRNRCTIFKDMQSAEDDIFTVPLVRSRYNKLKAEILSALEV